MALDVPPDSATEHPIKVLLVYDHLLFRESLVGYLSAQPGLKVVAAVSTGAQAIEQLSQVRPDVVLLDLRLGASSGLDVLMQIKARPYAPRVLVVSSHEGDAMVRRAMSLGADGYISKSVSSYDLLSAIRKTHEGRRALSPEIAASLANTFDEPRLTEREIEILQHIASGLTNKEVASRMGVTEKTIKNRLVPIFVKLNASDRTRAVLVALERGFIGPPPRGNP